ncbi:ornithine carbamoyltransferase [Microbispora rosea subsp. aerata]|nr:ornithine carbamoyltransferase [Microbispora rosea]GGO11520.1 ornithine carbamoyltransferase [Microbispora rosea subsp. aerata]GIH55754.1 ornithine carbamoyltransferase [Microbispora rosea subsp. aerata]GLJ85948.1 ornithine carbamoyltransferase [Microbispora rosea subsp. aerata]
MSHLLSLREFTGEQLDALVRKALEIKQNPEAYRSALAGKGLLLLMQKTSTRTVLAFTAAIHQMGGYTVRMNWDESNFAISPLDLEARYISTTADAVMARLRSFDDVAALAANSSIPVINGCCSRYHPSQVVADCLTVLETAGRMEGVGLTYVGVHNNVTNSLLAGCTRLGMRVNLVTPLRHDGAIDDELVAEAEATGLVRRFDTVAAAAAESDFVYTDTWVDMEHFDDPDYQEEKQRRIKLMSPFQLNRDNLGGADPWIMHDMPIHPGYEISRELVDAPKSVIFRQAENRLYAAKAILHELITT